MARLNSYPWPGNIRELESTVSRAALSAPGRVIRDTDIEFLHPQATVAADAPPRVPTLAEAERAHIVRVLEATTWNKKEAARLLDISRGTLYRKIVEYGLVRREPERLSSARETTGSFLVAAVPFWNTRGEGGPSPVEAAIYADQIGKCVCRNCTQSAQFVSADGAPLSHL
jgi:predicted DNA-binding protein (UPF0251 family)